jgi:hypothetical protein
MLRIGLLPRVPLIVVSLQAGLNPQATVVFLQVGMNPQATYQTACLVSL